MSKERKIDDSELAVVSGAGDLVTPDDSTTDDGLPPTDKTDPGSGGSGPNVPDPIGGGGGGQQTPHNS